MAALANGIGTVSGMAAMPGTRPWFPYVKPAEANPIVHLVDFEPEMVAEMSDAFAAAGVSTRLHPHADALAEVDLCDAPGCIVLRTRQAQVRLLGLFADVQRKVDGLPIVVAADRADARTVVVAMKAGAVDFVEPPFDDGLLEAVEAAIRIDRRRRQSNARNAEVRRRFAALTPREREVMALVTQGRLNKQAAGDLGLSEITVKAHRGSAMRKMAARTIADLVRMADMLAATGGVDTEMFRSRR